MSEFVIADVVHPDRLNLIVFRPQEAGMFIIDEVSILYGLFK
jgi:hypothetical protein